MTPFNPITARAYIKWFSEGGIPGRNPTEIRTNTGRIIEFDSMTDEDAIFTATRIREDIVSKSLGILQLSKPRHGRH